MSAAMPKRPAADSRPKSAAASAQAAPGGEDLVQIARDVLTIEAEGILHLAEVVDQTFAQAVRWIFEDQGRVIVTGIGKSGIVGRKIVATLSSTGTPALFLHPVEAMHGDLGMVRAEDIVLALSNSGETDELNIILPSLRSLGARLIALTGNLQSTLARTCDLALYTGVPREACPLGLAPTASTTAMLAMGDALAVALIKKRNFQPGDFRRYHPGGQLGERLLVDIAQVMRRGDEVPVVCEAASIRAALEIINQKGLGATLVESPRGRLAGIFTDGDLRRALSRYADLEGKTIGAVMTRDPQSIRPQLSAAAALEIMEHRQITVLPVVDEANRILGVLHLHDLLGKGKIRFTG